VALDGSGCEPLETDLALIARAQCGEVDAFAALYDRLAPKVLGLARRLLASRCDADDLLHDVFLEAWQAVREYDPARATVATWLCVRTRSRAFDRLARRKREQLAQRGLEQSWSCEQPPSAAETRLALRTALVGLDAPVRNAIELMYVGGFTAGEISAQTRVPEGTVRSRLARGLSHLEQALR
jgi:RNA polymerase sigma-70 factor (ECF subfamily)